MRRAPVLQLLVSVAGCSGVGAPCLPWDDGCASAALAAEGAIGPGWNAVAVSGVGCENAASLISGGEPGRCWEVRLSEDARPGGTAEVFVVEMTDGTLVTVTTAITD